MTENEKIAALLFPHITMTPADYEAKYPPRQLKEGARVSRFSPSPICFPARRHTALPAAPTVCSMCGWKIRIKSAR